jgi:hypothetical protein
MGLLSDKELGALVPADQVDTGTPIPTRLVSSDEYLPIRQTARQKQVEARMNELGDAYGRRNGLSRRRFFHTAAGDRLADIRTQYERQGRDPSNKRYGYVLPG